MNSQPIIQNIVCTCNLGSAIYLQGLAQRLQVCEYNPRRFAAVTFRLKYPKTTALIFSSGKLVCTGAKSKNEARLALLYYVHLIRERLQLDIAIYEFEVQNMVASANVGHAVSLDKLFLKYTVEASYEPELFPGLVFRQMETRVVFLIFDSGRLVITGAKIEQEIFDAFHQIKPLIAQFQKDATDVKPSTVDKRQVLLKADLAVLREEEWGPLLSGILEED